MPWPLIIAPNSAEVCSASVRGSLSSCHLSKNSRLRFGLAAASPYLPVRCSLKTLF